MGVSDRRQTGWCLLVTLAMGVLCGCSQMAAGWEVGSSLPEFQNRWIAVSNPHGARRLELESRYDMTLKGFVAEYGAPDALYVESLHKVSFVYMQKNFVATFVRNSWSSNSTVSTSPGVPKTIADALASTPAAPTPKGTREVNSTVRIASCFAVSPSGLVLTAAHAVAGAREIQLSFPDGNSGQAKVLRLDKGNDVALLQFERDTPGYLSAGSNSRTSLGDHVFTIGYPAIAVLGINSKYSDGTVSALSGIMDSPSQMQITVPVQPGNSGGPLANDRGEVLGVVIATASAPEFLKMVGSLPQNINWATKIEYASPLYPSPPAIPPAANRKDAIGRVGSATCALLASE